MATVLHLVGEVIALLLGGGRQQPVSIFTEFAIVVNLGSDLPVMARFCCTTSKIYILSGSFQYIADGSSHFPRNMGNMHKVGNTVITVMITL